MRVFVTIVLAIAALLMLAVGGSWLRRLPSQSEEAKGHIKAVESLISGLKDALPDIEPIIRANSRATAWTRQKPVDGKVSVSLDELKEVVTQLDLEQDTISRTRTVWVAVDAETKTHTAKLATSLGDIVWPDSMRVMLRTLRDLLLLAGWPLALVLALAYFLHSDRVKDRLALLGKTVQKIALPGGVSLTLWGEEFRQDQSDTFKKFRADVQAEYDKLAERFTIKDTLARILKDSIVPALTTINSGAAIDYRATIHVRDALFKNSYYQLIDYLPTGGNRGRAWSVRYGMVGRAWRLENDSWNGEVPSTVDDLIQDWGMTRDEAQSPGRHTMLCCILKSGTGAPVGALYMDAKGKDEFGSNSGRQTRQIDSTGFSLPRWQWT